MGLRQKCPLCGLNTIPKRIVGLYVGSADSIKIWECRECLGLWSNQDRPYFQSGETSVSSIKKFN
jgi:ribosomal protein L37AE/L43A